MITTFSIDRSYNTLLYLILWRVISVFLVQTAHVPDEYWQSLEVAHRLAFGYGYLTWEWEARIRSYIYPFVISILYWLLALLHLDYVTMLTTTPRLLHAILSGYADYRFYLWTGSKWALFSLCTNWYWYYCATRTIINSVETALTIIALSMFPWPNSQNRSSNFLWIIAVLCATRPTAAIVWIPLCLYHLFINLKSKPSLILQYILIGGTVLLVSTLVDTLCYGQFVISPWEFFRINVLNNVGDFYGTHRTLWYLTSALPVLLGLHCLTLPIAIWQVIKHFTHLHQGALIIVVIGWTVSIYSILSHKEFRFILPVLPMLIYLCTCGTLLNYRISESKRKIFLALFIISNLLPGVYFSLVHQRGALDVMKVMRLEFATNNNTDTDILFLTPCHATPLYSHLHKDISIRFLTCEPNLGASNDYVDETKLFFAHPMLWLNNNYIMKRGAPLPHYLIMYDNLASRIVPFLRDYRPIVKVFDSHFPQPNYGEYIIVYKRKFSEKGRTKSLL
ncbi:GPI mannosyltransferase 3 [Cephus cinctus]|uniref:Mannosyltransferase n=1 Tax=Cephus cinctus TaxID=211228 RepID=A0AAJ7C2S9_CEPCN|nr:GPI mannosyltransferase 3 [Cephus cinctus]XP_015600523.1 GPI mannosyltransferase 3 [Cephus cinctus]